MLLQKNKYDNTALQNTHNEIFFISTPISVYASFLLRFSSFEEHADSACYTKPWRSLKERSNGTFVSFWSRCFLSRRSICAKTDWHKNTLGNYTQRDCEYLSELSYNTSNKDKQDQKYSQKKGTPSRSLLQLTLLTFNLKSYYSKSISIGGIIPGPPCDAK